MSDDITDRENLETVPLTTEALAKLRAVKMAHAQGQKVSLLIYFRDGVRVVHLGEGESVVIGRTKPADVPIRDRSLSRQHATVEVIDGEIWVEDLQSTNGTWIDGERVDRCRVGTGAELVFGAVPASVHSLGRSDEPDHDLETHDRFVQEMDGEVQRAQIFGRKLALLLLHGDRKRQGGHLGRWLPLLRERVRPFDRIAMYSGDTVEVLLPDADEAFVSGFALMLLGEVPALRAGAGVFPDHGRSAEELFDVTRSALQVSSGQSPLQIPGSGATGEYTIETTADDAGGPVIASAAMEALFRTVDRLTTSVVPVLIQGETGSGKEIIAQAIHEGGPRHAKLMQAVNCAALPPQLIESTLFGHEKGSFTGAEKRTQGVFEAADGGTVFLDEIGELPAAAQAALLRVLETKRFTRVGSNDEIEVDVRIVAATHRNLEEMCEAGTFRWDLFYRLNVMALEIPPLRQRLDDIEPLARRFLKQANAANHSHVRGFEDESIALLLVYHWPGNVRELRNAVERAVVIAQGDRIGIEDLPGKIQRLDTGSRSMPSDAEDTAPTVPPLDGEDINLKNELQRYESELILGALRAASGDRADAARQLGLPVRTLAYKMKQLMIKRSGYDKS